MPISCSISDVVASIHFHHEELAEVGGDSTCRLMGGAILTEVSLPVANSAGTTILGRYVIVVK